MPLLSGLRDIVTPEIDVPFDVVVAYGLGVAASAAVAVAVAPHESSAVVDWAVYPDADTPIVIKVVWFWFDERPVNTAEPFVSVEAVCVPAVTAAPCIAAPVAESVTATLRTAVVHAVVGHELP